MAANAGSALISLLFPLSTQLNSIYLLMALRFFMGLCQSAFFPAAYVLFCRWLPEKERAVLLPIMFIGSNIGNISTYIMSSYLITSAHGWPSVFYMSGLICTLVTIFWCIFGSNGPEDNRFITDEERHYIVANVTNQSSGSNSLNELNQIDAEEQRIEEEKRQRARNKLGAIAEDISLKDGFKDLNNMQRKSSKDLVMKKSASYCGEFNGTNSISENNNNLIVRDIFNQIAQQRGGVVEVTRKEGQNRVKTDSPHHKPSIGAQDRRAGRTNQQQANVGGAPMVVVNVLSGCQKLEGERRLIMNDSNRKREGKVVDTRRSVENTELSWCKLLKSIPVWTLIFSMYGNEWSNVVMCFELPTYLNTALSFPIEQNGVINSFFQLSYTLASPIMSSMGAYMLDKHVLGMRKIHVRKLFQSLATFGQLACFVSVPICGANRGLIIMFMFSAIVFKACANAGDIMVAGDLSPGE